jgi:hypothetical protein
MADGGYTDGRYKDGYKHKDYKEGRALRMYVYSVHTAYTIYTIYLRIVYGQIHCTVYGYVYGSRQH